MVYCRLSQHQWFGLGGGVFDVEAASRAYRASEETLSSYQHTGGWAGLERGEPVHLLSVSSTRPAHARTRGIFLPTKTDLWHAETRLVERGWQQGALSN